MPGMEEEEEHAPKYMPLEDLSDSDETDMDLSDSENEASGDSAEQPKKKQAKTETGAADGNSVPKWSNPDPYFVLPPVDESTHKKKDVVKLIRKARVQDAMNALPKPGADADDFISFDFGDEDEAEESEKESEADGPADRIHDQSNGFSHRDEIVGPRPPKQDLDVATPPAKARAMEPNTDSDLGNRKRTYDDKIKGPSMVPKPVPRGASSGKITSEWRAKDGIDPTPWLLDHSETANLGAWYVV
jgi:non-canonical poly(A) RNA polymerase PAPD5/7